MIQASFPTNNGKPVIRKRRLSYTACEGVEEVRKKIKVVTIEDNGDNNEDMDVRMGGSEAATDVMSAT
jgi:hypothetical protein